MIYRQFLDNDEWRTFLDAAITHLSLTGTPIQEGESGPSFGNPAQREKLTRAQVTFTSYRGTQTSVLRDSCARTLVWQCGIVACDAWNSSGGITSSGSPRGGSCSPLHKPSNRSRNTGLNVAQS